MRKILEYETPRFALTLKSSLLTKLCYLSIDLCLLLFKIFQNLYI